MRLKEIEARLAEIKEELNTRAAELTDEEITKLETEVTDLQEERTTLLTAAEKRKKLLERIAAGEPTGGAGADTTLLRNFKGAGGAGAGEPEDKYDTTAYRKAFMNYVCRGVAIPAEYRAAETTTTADSGAVIPTTIMNEIIQKLDKDPQLKQEFIAVYPQGFSGDNITDAIAEFEKTLITPNSPFDKWLRGDEAALTAQQKHGYQLFKDNKCATCHGGIILGGRSFEPLGLKKDFNFGEVTAADIGRMNVTNELRDKLRQKVPGLRNVALTAPYFHRGDVPTLDGAVKLMLRYQVGKELPQEDIDDIVAFLESLNGVYKPYMQGK